MRTYLVGGAVRDKLIGCEPKDLDFVVVGSTPEEMLAHGFTQVGADFPVFLKEGCEYALARTERKFGRGYAGFVTDHSVDVTLEEDLLRRDLTINAIAFDPDTGEFIDPHHGRRDLELQVLRHVSDAFAEDPVRVLRVARFQARFGFTIADETRDLMSHLVASGELDHLTDERVWSELERAIMERQPWNFFHTLQDVGALRVLFPELQSASGTINERLTVTNSRRLTFEQRVALVFSTCTMDEGRSALKRLTASTKLITLTSRVKSLLSMVLNSTDAPVPLTAENAMLLLTGLDAFRQPDVFLLALDTCTKLIRGGSIEFDIDDISLVRLEQAFHVSNAVSFNNLPHRLRLTLKGQEVGLAIRDARKMAITKAFERLSKASAV